MTGVYAVRDCSAVRAEIQVTRGRKLSLYAAVWDAEYEVVDQLGHYRERVARNAFTDAIGRGRTLLMLDHGRGFLSTLPLGPVRSITQDSRGLLLDAELHQGDAFAPVVEAIESGALAGASVRMRVSKDTWNRDRTARVVERVSELPEVSVVGMPASPATSLKLREAAPKRPGMTRRDMQRMALPLLFADADRRQREYVREQARRVLGQPVRR